MTRLIIAILIVSSGSQDRPPVVKGGEDMAELARGINRFAFDLYGRLGEGEGNLFVSPYSLSTALAMTYAGARGETAEQIDRMLRFPIESPRLHSANGALIRGLQSGEHSYQLSVANALWGQEGIRFRPDFLKLAEGEYGARLDSVDFRGDAAGARQQINAWVSEQTKGKIKELLKPPNPSPQTALVLTNAVYFRAAWAVPFSEAMTKPEDFRAAADSVVRVPMMHQTGLFGYLDGEQFQALELPYDGGDLSMMILLPKQADGLDGLERSMGGDKAAGRLSGLKPSRVAVALPKFRLSSAFELKPVLSAMGMPLAFSPKADFSGISEGEDLAVSDVVHEAYVSVDEKGTEAAAASAVIMGRSAPPTGPIVTFRADHPFVFLIRDRATGCILFIGRVRNPGS